MYHAHELPLKVIAALLHWHLYLSPRFLLLGQMQAPRWVAGLTRDRCGHMRWSDLRPSEGQVPRRISIADARQAEISLSSRRKLRRCDHSARGSWLLLWLLYVVGAMVVICFYIVYASILTICDYVLFLCCELFWFSLWYLNWSDKKNRCWLLRIKLSCAACMPISWICPRTRFPFYPFHCTHSFAWNPRPTVARRREWRLWPMMIWTIRTMIAVLNYKTNNMNKCQKAIDWLSLFILDCVRWLNDCLCR